jgi:membrane protein DedA with SNARE-associated domain
MSRAINVFSPFLALFLLSSCNGEQWFNERTAEAHTLPPAAIASFLFAGGFVSEDLSCVSAGVLVSKGSLPYWLAALACTFGVWVSDSLIYFWGWIGRRGLLERAPLRWFVERSRIERGAGIFERHGAKVLILSRFMPGSRVPIYLTAGFLGYPFARFAGWMALAAAIWAPVMVWLSLTLGQALLMWLEGYEKIAWIAMPMAVLVIWIGLRGLEKFAARRAKPLLQDSPREAPAGSEE